MQLVRLCDFIRLFENIKSAPVSPQACFLYLQYKYAVKPLSCQAFLRIYEKYLSLAIALSRSIRRINTGRDQQVVGLFIPF